MTHPNCPCGHRPTDHYEDTRAMNMACRMCDCRTPVGRTVPVSPERPLYGDLDGEIAGRLLSAAEREKWVSVNAPFFREHAVTLVESLAIAMADAEGNAEAAVRGLWTNYDALGYGRLAKAALHELRRLGLLPEASTANTATGADGSP